MVKTGIALHGKSEKRALQSRRWQLIGKSQSCCSAMRPSIARANGQAHHCSNQPQQAFTPYAFSRWRILSEVTDIRLQLTTHLSTSKGWKAELG